MAGTMVESYSQIGDRESLINIITNISPEETPFMTRVGKGTCSFRTHEWQTETLQSANSGNAEIEGSTAAFASTNWTSRTRVANYTQILRRTFSSSYSQESMDVAGLTSEFDHQRVLKTKELARDINAALINQESASGASGTARTMRGLLAALTTNTASGGGVRLDTAGYNDLCQTIWTAGGNPNATYCNGFQKRTISGFSTPVTRNIDANGKKMVVAIDVYDSDFGRQVMVLERQMPADTIALIEEKYFKTAFLRPLFYEETAKVGGQRRGYVESELTLEFLAENSSGKITGLATA